MKTALVQNKPILAPENGLSILAPLSFGENLRFSFSISIIGHEYLVDMKPKSRQRYHWVNKNKECSCGDVLCDAILLVRISLQHGGPRAPDREGMPPCPICGGKTFRDPVWDGKRTHTLGWRCSTGGLRHFLEARTEQIKRQRTENERRLQENLLDELNQEEVQTLEI